MVGESPPPGNVVILFLGQLSLTPHIRYAGVIYIVASRIEIDDPETFLRDHDSILFSDDLQCNPELIISGHLGSFLRNRSRADG